MFNTSSHIFSECQGCPHDSTAVFEMTLPNNQWCLTIPIVFYLLFSIYCNNSNVLAPNLQATCSDQKRMLGHQYNCLNMAARETHPIQSFSHSAPDMGQYWFHLHINHIPYTWINNILAAGLIWCPASQSFTKTYVVQQSGFCVFNVWNQNNLIFYSCTKSIAGGTWLKY